MAKPWEGERLYSHRIMHGCSAGLWIAARFTRAAFSAFSGFIRTLKSATERTGTFRLAMKTSHPPTAAQRVPPSLYERGIYERGIFAFTRSRATSVIMSSWPPTIRRLPSSISTARVSSPWSAAAFSAWRKKDE